ncbi:flagellar hook protein FlgE [bacterium]|nr:flagellar hook protein FlgE [bacterium]NBX82134.1 flagellar hook protein FlgE [bacterium]
MGVVSSMSTAISGLESNGQALGVITDNIVNANTTGFKASRSEFQNILAETSGGGIQVGRGATLAGVTNILNQGSITHTDRPTDLAISGNGFFILKGDALGQTYTRDGSFRFDKDGWLVNLNGYRVQAYEATPSGAISGKLSDIRIPYNTIAAKSTERVQMHVNLDARAPIGAPIDLTKPEETSNFNTGVQIFDSVGNARPITMYYNKTGENVWEFYAMTDGANLTDGVPGEQSVVAQGSLSFDQNGRLEGVQQNIVNSNFVGAIPDQNLQFDFGDPIDQLGSGEKGTTQYGSKSAMFRNVQDGWASGTLTDTSIDADGMVSGVYTNGQNRILGQLGVARFEATERLAKMGDNQFRESVLSGQPLVGKPNTNGRGIIMTKSLEQSNVDLAHEFVQMIKAQRGFQASAKGVTTANEMLDEVVNLKSR